MIDIASSLAQMIKTDIPAATINLPGDGAIMVSNSSESSLMMFAINGSTLTVPTWVMNRNVFRHAYDLANQEDLIQFINSLKLALSS